METEQTPFVYKPVHTKQAQTALGLLLFFSFLMFSLPFGAYYGTLYFLNIYVTDSKVLPLVLPVIASVITVNLIIGVYIYIAYHENDYDSEGNLIPKEGRASHEQISGQIKED